VSQRAPQEEGDDQDCGNDVPFWTIIKREAAITHGRHSLQLKGLCKGDALELHRPAPIELGV
jgi:hypothetical protein